MNHPITARHNGRSFYHIQGQGALLSKAGSRCVWLVPQISPSLEPLVMARYTCHGSGQSMKALVTIVGSHSKSPTTVSVRHTMDCHSSTSMGHFCTKSELKMCLAGDPNQPLVESMKVAWCTCHGSGQPKPRKALNHLPYHISSPLPL